MTTKLFTKPKLQEVLRDLRKAGYHVVSNNGMYNVYMSNKPGDTEVLTALRGHNAYLVTYNSNLITEVKE